MQIVYSKSDAFLSHIDTRTNIHPETYIGLVILHTGRDGEEEKHLHSPTGLNHSLRTVELFEHFAEEEQNDNKTRKFRIDISVRERVGEKASVVQ